MQEMVDKRFGKSHPDMMKNFNAYKCKFCTVFDGKPTLKKVDSPGLYKNFDRIVCATRPKRFYVNSDWGTRSLFRFLNVIPVSWSDALRTILMRLPR